MASLHHPQIEKYDLMSTVVVMERTYKRDVIVSFGYASDRDVLHPLESIYTSAEADRLNELQKASVPEEPTLCKIKSSMTTQVYE